MHAGGDIRPGHLPRHLRHGGGGGGEDQQYEASTIYFTNLCIVIHRVTSSSSAEVRALMVFACLPANTTTHDTIPHYLFLSFHF